MRYMRSATIVKRLLDASVVVCLLMALWDATTWNAVAIVMDLLELALLIAVYRAFFPSEL